MDNVLPVPPQDKGLSDEIATDAEEFRNRVHEAFKTVSELTEIPPDMEDKIREDFFLSATWTEGGGLFTTSDGYIGMVRDPIEEGDHLCIIYGSKYPAILRPRRESFELVTIAWVHGAMAGECVAPENRERERKYRVI